ncbi:MAG: hypothetical protein JRI43_01955 [Deltaproteobacteria bacterium]|nr:hypothetical protein [Deltaproteobacteria bacterium]
MKLRRLIVCVIVIALFGCQIWKDKTVPEELLGMWETSSSRYADCFFEFQGELIIFNNGLSYNAINFIKDIEKLPENGKTLYNIYYEDKEGQEFKLSLFYFHVRNGGVIRFKNQKDIEWTRRRKQAVPHS